MMAEAGLRRFGLQVTFPVPEHENVNVSIAVPTF